jgi:hypothetical protein
MQLKLFASVLFLLAVVNCDYWTNEGISIQYSYLPVAQLGSFEGSYSSNSRIGFFLNICQDDNLIYGAYDELGIFHGNVSDNTASGTWYQAGKSPCSFGDFELKLTAEGFEGFFNCNGAPNERQDWIETKISPFRPADRDCALMDFGSPLSMTGRYIDEYNLPKDLCIDGDAATGSLLYPPIDGTDELVKEFYEAVSHKDGKISTGTWYGLYPEAGASLYYIDTTGAIIGYWWTGLSGTEGETVINPAELRTSYHGLEYFTGPISKTTSESCDDYATIKTKVLNNLVADYDDDLYYFVTSDFNNVLDDDGGDDEGAIDDEDYSNSDASHIYWSILPLLLALLY